MDVPRVEVLLKGGRWRVVRGVLILSSHRARADALAAAAEVAAPLGAVVVEQPPGGEAGP